MTMIAVLDFTFYQDNLNFGIVDPPTPTHPK